VTAGIHIVRRFARIDQSYEVLELASHC